MDLYKKVHYLIGDQIKKILLFIFLYMISASLDLASIGLLFPFFSSLNNESLSQEYDGITAFLNLNLDYPIIYLILILLLFVLKSALSISILNNINKFCDDVQLVVAKKLFNAYQNIDYRDYARTNKSVFIDSLGKWPGHLSQRYLMILIKLIGESIISFCMILIMLLINWKITVSVFLVIVLFIIIFDRIFKKKANFYSKGSNFHSVNRTKAIQESLGNLKSMKIYQLENFFSNLMSYHVKSDLSLVRRVNLINFFPRYAFEIIAVFFFLLIIYLALSYGYKIEEIFPYLTAVGIAALRLKPFGELLATGLVRLRTSQDSINRIYEYVKKFDNNSILDLKKNIDEIEFNEIKLKNIVFFYTKEKKILDNLNLVFEKGKITGITGPSGSGKSSIVDIITGFLKPIFGKVELDNTDITNKLSILRNISSYNTQDIFLLDTTIEENIAIGQDKDEINYSKISEIMNFLSLDELAIRIKTDLLQNQTLSKGINLSGGEKQRVAIARAIYFNRKILIFDESTNALDSDNTEKILSYLRNIKKNKIILVISHQNEVLSYCDNVYRLYKGKLK